jgi:bacillithiol synthase
LNITSTPFSQLPFSDLFKDYTSNYTRLAPFFNTDPFSEIETAKKMESYSFHGNRTDVVRILTDFNLQFNASNKVIQSIEKLEDERCLAVVTGQQLTIYGGPLFTILKIITAIRQAKYWERKFGYPFVPVFWMADEDHDFEEAAAIGLFDRDDHKIMSLKPEQENHQRVAEILLGDQFEIFRNEVQQLLMDTDFSDHLWEILDNTYKKGATFSAAFGKLILILFGKYGLILAGTNSEITKRAVTEPLIKSVEKAPEIFDVLHTQSDELNTAGYHKQVYVQYSNLFWIDEHKNREKITYSGNIWHIEGKDMSWDKTGLISAIKKSPDRFSPNVFLRPITQSWLLPCVAYVAGPSEVAYYAQMKDLYRLFDLKMPIILPRFSAAIIESGIDRIIDKLPFENFEYNQRIEDLESAYISRADTPDIESLFKNWKENAAECSEMGIQGITQIDQTLKGSAEKVITSYFNDLEKLKGKVYRSVKEQEKTQLGRLRRIQNSLFPNGNLQDREVAFIYFMNKYGIELWDNILSELDGHTPDSHKWIHL